MAKLRQHHSLCVSNCTLLPRTTSKPPNPHTSKAHHTWHHSRTPVCRPVAHVHEHPCLSWSKAALPVLPTTPHHTRPLLAIHIHTSPALILFNAPPLHLASIFSSLPPSTHPRLELLLLLVLSLTIVDLLEPTGLTGNECNWLSTLIKPIASARPAFARLDSRSRLSLPTASKADPWSHTSLLAVTVILGPHQFHKRDIGDLLGHASGSDTLHTTSQAQQPFSYHGLQPLGTPILPRLRQTSPG
jgi:hypothetical protein